AHHPLVFTQIVFEEERISPIEPRLRRGRGTRIRRARGEGCVASHGNLGGKGQAQQSVYCPGRDAASVGLPANLRRRSSGSPSCCGQLREYEAALQALFPRR